MIFKWILKSLIFFRVNKQNELNQKPKKLIAISVRKKLNFLKECYQHYHGIKTLFKFN